MRDLLATYKVRWRRAKGFTLVELLIVIMIIAILAGMLLMATGSSTATAKATRLINDLRNLKSAAMMWGLERGLDPKDMVKVIWGGGDPNPFISEIVVYLDRPSMQISGDQRTGSSTLPIPPFALSYDRGGGVIEDRIFIGYDIGRELFSAGVSDQVKAKLTQQAKKSGLYGVSGTRAVYYDKDAVDEPGWILMMFE